MICTVSVSVVPVNIFFILFFTSSQLDTFNSMSISWGLHDLWGSSLILYMWFSLMLRPVSMGSQDSVQELLGNRLTPSLLWGDFCCVNQCFPFILQETTYVKQKLEASNSNMTPKTTQVIPISTQC